MTLEKLGRENCNMFWSKPKKKVLVDVGKATAILTMESEHFSNRHITRVGDFMMHDFIVKGDSLLYSYLCSSKTMLKDDSGAIILVHKISKITIVSEPHMIEVEE